MNNYLPLVCTLVGVAGVLYAIIVAGMVKSAPAGNDRMKQISGAIAEGAIGADHIAGELGGMGLIRNAVTQGRQAVGYAGDGRPRPPGLQRRKRPFRRRLRSIRRRPRSSLL